MCRITKTAQVALATALAFISLNPSARAQQLGSIVGSVTDQMTLAPLVGASVSVIDHELSAVTNEDGHFTIAGIPAGDVSVRMEHLDHIAVVVQVAVPAREVAFIQAELSPLAFVLGGLRVVTEPFPEDRGGGSAVTEFQPTEAESAYSAMELLRARVPSMQLYGGESRGGMKTHIQLRGSGSVMYSTQPSLYIDGIKASLELLADLPSVDVRRMRVLKGPSASSQYPDAVNGVILVDTWRGRIPSRKPGPPPA